MATSDRASPAPAGLLAALARSPILWGSLACTAFYGLVRAEVLDSPLLRRYFASHPVEYVATAMFFVGLAALAVKAIDIAVQHRGLGKPLLGPIPQGGQPVTACEPLADQLRRLSQSQQSSYRVRRLRDALEHVHRNGSPQGLAEQLNYLAELDAGRLHASYGLVRMFIWAIPILGFLGTVIGIAQAMGNLAPQALEDSLPDVMAGLTVAFDTTTLALGLCIVLFFAQYFTNQKETSLLAEVDQRVEQELVGRFQGLPERGDGQLGAVGRMAGTVIESTERLVRRQAELWQASIEAAQKRWTAMADSAGEQLQTALAGALAESLKLHAREVVIAGRLANEENQRHWQQVQQTLVRNTEMLDRLQKAMVEKAEVLDRAVRATDQVAQLQATLNQNLQALAGAKNFEQTVISLAAAIHLLNARLAELPTDAPQVQLEPDAASRPSQAA